MALGADSDSDDDMFDLNGHRKFPMFPRGQNYQEGLVDWKINVVKQIMPPRNAKERLVKNQLHVKYLVPTSLATTAPMPRRIKLPPRRPVLVALLPRLSHVPQVEVVSQYHRDFQQPSPTWLTHEALILSPWPPCGSVRGLTRR
jgi:hypothetical protein